jgi:predicted acyl esterase
MVIQSNVPIRMSDGSVLYANIGYPTDPTTGKRAVGRFPVLLTQNPYAGPTAQPDSFFVSRGYIFVSAGVRGSGLSMGPNATEVADDLFGPRSAQDGVELVNWAAHRLDGSNGIVGLTGCSYLGIDQLFTAAAAGPDSPIKAILPACASNSYDVYFAGGIPSQEGWLLGDSGAILGTRNAAANTAAGQALGAEIQAGVGRAYNNAYWQKRTTANVGAQIVRNGIPALLWSGWSATEMPGPVELYAVLQNAWRHRPEFEPMEPNQPTTGRYQIIVGPGSHAEGLDKSIELEWFDTWLKGRKTNMAHTSTPMHLYENEAGRWVNAATYPLMSAYTPYYLGAMRTLATHRPVAPSMDPITWGPPTQTGTTLTYDSSPLPDGATLAGPVAASIYASSSNTNLEFIATLDDVAADGSAQTITTGAVLGSLRALDKARSWYDRNGLLVNPYHPFAADRYAQPGQVERYDIKLYPTVWSVKPGHTLRLVLSTEAAANDCGISLTNLPQALPCHLTAKQQATVPEGAYQVQYAPSFPSSLSLPLLADNALPTARSSTTATSAGQTEPIQWDSTRP